MSRLKEIYGHLKGKMKGDIRPNSKNNLRRGSVSSGDQGFAYHSQAPGGNAPISTDEEGGYAGLTISGSTPDMTQTMSPYPSSAVRHVDKPRVVGAEDNVGSPESLSPRWGKTKEALAVVGRLTQTILSKIPDVVTGDPVKTTFSLIKIILEAKEAISDNKNMLDEHIVRAAERLRVVITATGNGNEVPKGVEDPFRIFTKSMEDVLVKLQTLKGKSRTLQIFDYEKHKEDIEAIFSEIDNAAATFQLEMIAKIQTIARGIDQLLKDNLLRDLRPATTAIHSTVESQSLLGRTTCTEDTRVDILRRIEGWAEDTSPGSPSVFWLTGQAGSGKTTILQTIAVKYSDRLQKSKTRLGASFFCSIRFPETRRRDRIIPTTAHQLMDICTPYSDALQALNISDARPRPVNTVSQDVNVQLMSLLVIPWQQSESARVREDVTYLVVLDALDEMDGSDAVIFLQQLFAAMSSHKLLNLKILVASRTSPDILQHVELFLQRDEYWLQRVSAQDASADVMTYLKSELPLLEHQHHLQIEEHAKGLFIYAATAVKFVKPRLDTPRSRQEKQLNKLLSYSRTSRSEDDGPEFVIDRLYRQIVVEAFSAYNGEEFRQQRKLLHTFLSTAERESPTTVAAFCGESYDVEEARQLVKSLHAVLYTGVDLCLEKGYREQDNDRVFWYHASFPDFIFDSARSRFQLDGIMHDFFCNESSQKGYLFETCFQHLKAGLHFNMANIQSSFDPNPDDYTANPALVYAAENWQHYLPLGGDIEAALTLLDGFLELRALFWIEMATIGAQYYPYETIRVTLEWVQTHAKHRLDLLENLHDLRRFTDATYIEDVFIPQLYITFLSTFCDSKLIQKWKSNFTGLPILSNTWRHDLPVKFDISGSTEMLNPYIRHPYGLGYANVAFFDDTRAISAAHHGSVEIWDIASGEQVREFTIDSEQYSPSLECQTVVTFTPASGQTNILDAITGHVVRFLPKKPLSTRAVAVSQDRKWIAQAQDHVIHTCDISSGYLLKTFNGHTDNVNTVTIFGKGQYMVSGSSDRTLRIWEVSTGETKYILSGHTDMILATAVSSDDACIVSGSDDATVRIWSTATGQEIRCMEGHFGFVSSVTISNDSRIIVSGSHDATVRVWDAATGVQLMAFVGLGSSVSSVAISECNTSIVVGLDDGRVMRWDVNMHISTHRPDIAPLPDWALVKEGRLVSSLSGMKLVNNRVLSLPGQGLMVRSSDEKYYGSLDISQSRDIFGDDWASCYRPVLLA